MRVLRKSILNWGATEKEASARLPGDELLEQADGVSTRAIDIDAPPAAVWPWLAPMGPFPRGGAYTYDWIENLLGLNMHSTSGVLAEFQHPEVGETFSLGSNRMRMDRVEAERVLAWRSEDGNWGWTFVLQPRDGGTRLISRNRFRLPKLVARIGMLPMEPGSLIMERKMLRGIKQRAEQLARKRSTRQPERPLCFRRSPGYECRFRVSRAAERMEAAERRFHASRRPCAPDLTPSPDSRLNRMRRSRADRLTGSRREAPVLCEPGGGQCRTCCSTPPGVVARRPRCRDSTRAARRAAKASGIPR